MVIVVVVFAGVSQAQITTYTWMATLWHSIEHGRDFGEEFSINSWEISTVTFHWILSQSHFFASETTPKVQQLKIILCVALLVISFSLWPPTIRRRQRRSAHRKKIQIDFVEPTALHQNLFRQWQSAHNLYNRPDMAGSDTDCGTRTLAKNSRLAHSPQRRPPSQTSKCPYSERCSGSQLLSAHARHLFRPATQTGSEWASSGRGFWALKMDTKHLQGIFSSR